MAQMRRKLYAMIKFVSQGLFKLQSIERAKGPHRFRRLMLLVQILIMLLAVSTVSAHSRLVQSEPANGQALEQSPDKVVAWFSEELDSGASEMQVFNAQGRQVDNGDGGVDLNDLDHLSMIATLPSELPESTYTVHWVAASAEDGDVVEGDFAFNVGLASSPSSPSGSVLTLWPLIGLIVVILAVAGGTAVFIRRRRTIRQEERIAS